MPTGNTNFPGALDVHTSGVGATPVEFVEHTRLTQTRLREAVDSSQNSIPIVDGSDFRTRGIAVIENETIYWEVKSAGAPWSLLTVTRGAFGSTAAAHAIDTPIGVVPTAALVNAHAAAIAAIEKKLGFKTGATGATASQIPSANTLLGGDAAGESSFRQVTAADLLDGTSTLKKIAEVILSSSAANIDFQSIPAIYRHLILIVSLRGDAVATNVATTIIFNNDTGANYDRLVIFNSSATAVAAAENLASVSMQGGSTPASTAATDRFSGALYLVPNYTDAKYKNMLALFGRFLGAVAGDGQLAINEFLWRSTAAINRITITPGSGNFVAGSTVALYGLPA